LRRRRHHEPFLVALLTTPASPDGHNHVAIFDGDGDGFTTFIGGHQHIVEGLEVKAGDTRHAHELTAIRIEQKIHSTKGVFR